jgi:transcriptional regulator with XRE-family HTH domain
MAKGTRTTEDRRIKAIFARRLREARSARGWTQQYLADRLIEMGVKMDRTAIARVERGQREVRLEELVAIAAALDVALVYLLFPIDGDVRHLAGPDKKGRTAAWKIGPLVRLAPGREVNQVKARRWASGEIPLDPANYRTYRDQTPGDRIVSVEELSPSERQVVNEEKERLLRKMGVEIIHEPAEQPSPTKRGRGRAPAGKD